MQKYKLNKKILNLEKSEVMLSKLELLVNYRLKLFLSVKNTYEESFYFPKLFESVLTEKYKLIRIKTKNEF